MSKPSLWRTMRLVCILCAVGAVSSPAQTFKTVVSFNGADGENPYFMSLVQGLDGNFYGTTAGGGVNNNELCTFSVSLKCGTVFKITPTGALSTLYSFCSRTNCTDGAIPYAGLVLVTDGNLYGTTIGGGTGTYTDGTVFRITSGGTLTTLYSFCRESGCPDGRAPYASLVQGSNGSFYGTTVTGGEHDRGTVFAITPAGKLTTLHSFKQAEGYSSFGRLIQASDGDFYGTARIGGDLSCGGPFGYGCGTVFKITPAGTLTVLHSFDGTDGANPNAGLVQATDGNFYGVTPGGGANNDGTIFKITPSGTLTTLHSFDYTDGAGPSQLVQATDGNFYGMTGGGGANNDGTVFKMTPSGTLTTLHSFDLPDGIRPYGGLVQATNGSFYGATFLGGTYGDGTVFSLSVGLGPFVETLPTSGKVDTAVIILGNNLTGSTSVTFNGTAATFEVVSSTEIKTTVPSGATTGKVQVKTPHGTLTSNVNFKVT
jgi:uncharacterized repeat protein (TIGR03803 family)